jgi:Tfp pilus assembly protein PilF
MKPSFLISVAAGLLLAGCGDNHSGKQAQATNSTATPTNATVNYNTGNPITAPVDYLGAVAQAKKYSEKQIDLAYLNEAIQQFNAAEGRYPKDLNELMPNYIGKIPQAPYGSKIVYDAASGTVKVVKQ